MHSATAAGGSSSRSGGMQRLSSTLLTHVLQYLPQHDRLTSAALVSSDFAKAANRATLHAQHVARSKRSLRAFEAWINKHSAQLLAIEVDGHSSWDGSSKGPKPQLPWTQLTALQRLDLIGCRLRHIPSCPASSSGVRIPRSHLYRNSSGNTTTPPLLPQLKQIKLEDCSLSCEGDLQRLAGTSLTSLVVRGSSSNTIPETQDSTASWSRLVQQLPHLQELKLRVDAGAFGSVFEQLPHSLTKLDLQDGRDMEACVASARATAATPRFPHDCSTSAACRC